MNLVLVTLLTYANLSSGPSGSDDFELLSGEDFLLLDGTNFLLLGNF